MNKNNCCDKCLGSARDVGIEYLCNDSDCICHTVKATQPKQEWEKDYELEKAKFLVFDKQSGSRFLDDENLKHFIRSQLPLSNKELAGRIEGMKIELPEREIGIPLTRSHVNGWNSACDEIISLLNQENI